MQIDSTPPLPLMAIDHPYVRASTTAEPVIVISFETKRVESEVYIPIELTMTPERAAVLLQLLQELRDRGIVPEIVGQIAETRYRQH